MDHGPITLETERLDGDGLAGLEGDWRELEGRGGGSPYVGYDWLAAWAATYEPAELRVLRLSGGAGVVALGLAEVRGGGRWSFAGGAVSPQRGLLCAPGAEHAAWDALGAWLRSHPGAWATLDGDCVPEDAAALPRARLGRIGVPGIELPASFEEYMAARSPTARKGLKQKLRRLDREQGEVREADDVAGALADFLRLHHARARSKSERHPQIDERLTAMLERLRALRVFELVVAGRRLGVSIRLDHGDTAFFYNSGIEPEPGPLSPGILLELGSIRDALDRGMRRFDLGPGEYRYKSDLGGVPVVRHSLLAVSPSPRARLLALCMRAGERSRAGLAPLRRRLRRGAPAR